MSIASWFSKLATPTMTLDNLEKVLVMQLCDLFSAEQQLVNALPEMAEAASSKELKQAFRSHLAETKTHVTRLQQIFKLLNQESGRETCEAMKGLIAEGKEIIRLDGEPAVKDAALIASAQRVEHYEIAAYGCARAFARRLGKADVARLLKATSEEEGNADKTLTRISESDIRLDTASAGSDKRSMPDSHRRWKSAPVRTTVAARKRKVPVRTTPTTKSAKKRTIAKK